MIDEFMFIHFKILRTMHMYTFVDTDRQVLYILIFVLYVTCDHAKGKCDAIWIDCIFSIYSGLPLPGQLQDRRGFKLKD